MLSLAFQQDRGLVTPWAWAHLQALLPFSDPAWHMPWVHGTDTMVSVSRDGGTGTEQGPLPGRGRSLGPYMYSVSLKSRLSFLAFHTACV